MKKVSTLGLFPKPEKGSEKEYSFSIGSIPLQKVTFIENTALHLIRYTVFSNV